MSDEKPFPCPCCGYLTSPEPWDICPVCFWENDASQVRDPDASGGANGISLRQAQRNFQNFGACNQDGLRHVAAHTFHRDPYWQPLNAD